VGIGRRSASVVALAVVLAACGSGHHAPAVRRSTLPLYTGMQGQRGIGGSDVAAIAGLSRVVNGTLRQLVAVGPAITRADPGVRIFVYANAMLSRPEEHYPAAWYLHDAAGHTVVSRVWGNALMDPRSTATYRGVHGWADHVRRRCAADLRAVRVASGCFLDMVGPAPLRPGYNRDGAVPVDPATRRPFAQAAYLAMTGRLAAGVQRFTDRPVVANGLESGAHYYAGTRVLGRGVAGLEVEHWMGVGAWQARNPARWRQNIQMLIDEGRAGHLLLVNFTPPPHGQAETWQSFGLASFLIGYSGSEFFQFSLGRGHPSWNDTPPTYGLRIGAPSEHATTVAGYAHNEVYWRRYSHGLAIVNPTAHTIAVPLPGRFAAPDGPTRTRITLRPHTGAVLAARP
jgi:hypothetical protein